MDPLEQIFMRGNIYQLAEMIMKDPALDQELKEINESQLNQSILDASTLVRLNEAPARTEVEKIQRICKRIMVGIGGPKTCLLRNINKVITKVESQINKKSSEGNKR